MFLDAVLKQANDILKTLNLKKNDPEEDDIYNVSDSGEEEKNNVPQQIKRENNFFMDKVLEDVNNILKKLNLKKNDSENDDKDKNSNNDSDDDNDSKTDNDTSNNSDSEEETNNVPQQIKRENNFFIDKVLEDVNNILKNINFKKTTEKQEVHVQLKGDNNNLMKNILNKVGNNEKQAINENNNNNNNNSDEKYDYDDIVFSEKTIIGNEITDSTHEIYNFNKSTGMMEKRE